MKILFKYLFVFLLNIIVLVTLSSGGSSCSTSSGSGGTVVCSVSNSSTYGFYFFPISNGIFNGCQTPYSNGRLYLDIAQQENWYIVNGSLKDTEDYFCTNFDTHDVQSFNPTLFNTKRPDFKDYYNCSVKLYNRNNSQCRYKSKRLNAPVTDWGGLTSGSAVSMNQLLLF